MCLNLRLSEEEEEVKEEEEDSLFFWNVHTLLTKSMLSSHGTENMHSTHSVTVSAAIFIRNYYWCIAMWDTCLQTPWSSPRIDGIHYCYLPGLLIFFELGAIDFWWTVALGRSSLRNFHHPHAFPRRNKLSVQGADKSLARPGRKQATATEDLSFIYPIYNHNWRNISTIYIYIVLCI